MNELIKLLCSYLKNGTADQKEMAEEIMLFMYTKKNYHKLPEYFMKYKTGMKMTNPKDDIKEPARDACDEYMDWLKEHDFLRWIKLSGERKLQDELFELRNCVNDINEFIRFSNKYAKYYAGCDPLKNQEPGEE